MSATVEKALQLIEALARSGEPVGVSQLGRELDINKSTVFRLLDTLCRHGYARQDEASGRYALSMKLWELGVGVVRGLNVRTLARPVLESEAAATGEGTLLGVVEGAQALIIDKVDSSQSLQIFSPLGARVSLANSSLGRALLAFQPAALVAEVIARFEPVTPHGIQTREELAADLESVRQEGCARSTDEWQIGVAGVAAPIRDAAGAVVAAICITGPSSRLGGPGMAGLQTRCLEAAAHISRLMGHCG